MNLYKQFNELNENEQSVTSLIASGLTKIMNEDQHPQEAIKYFKQFLKDARHSFEAQKELTQELIKSANHHLAMQRQGAAVITLNIMLNLLPNHEKAKDVKATLDQIKTAQHPENGKQKQIHTGPQPTALQAYLSGDDKTVIKKGYLTKGETPTRSSRFSNVDSFLEQRRVKIKLNLAPDGPDDTPKFADDEDTISGLGTLSQLK